MIRVLPSKDWGRLESGKIQDVFLDEGVDMLGQSRGFL